MKTFASCVIARPQERLGECTGPDLRIERLDLKPIGLTFGRWIGAMLRIDAMLDSSGMPLQTPSRRQSGDPMTERTADPQKETAHV